MENPPIETKGLVQQSKSGTVRITVGANNRIWQVTYYKNMVKQDIRGTMEEVIAHINSLPTTK